MLVSPSSGFLARQELEIMLFNCREHRLIPKEEPLVLDYVFFQTSNNEFANVVDLVFIMHIICLHVLF